MFKTLKIYKLILTFLSTNIIAKLVFFLDFICEISIFLIYDEWTQKCMKTILLKKQYATISLFYMLQKKHTDFSFFCIRMLFEANLKNVSVYLVNKVFI